jgi:tyrosyl-DNA phosphodiesterase-1
MRTEDIHLKTQGAFLQDFLLQAKGQRTSGEFQETLLSYIQTYDYKEQHVWQSGSSHRCTLVEQLAKYDYSTAKGVLIPSTPGYHKPSAKQKLGYLQVQKAISEYTPPPSSNSSSRPIICQYSSIGSLSKKYLQSLASAWDTRRVHSKRATNDKDANTSILQLVYPTHQEIVQSVEGISGGGSVPGRSSNVLKDFLQPLYHKWSSSSTTGAPHPLSRGRNVPHIKTYYQIADQDDDAMDWFVLSSHNLSKGKYGTCPPVLLE